MLNPAVEKEIIEQLGRLPVEQQQQVLAFARALTRQLPQGRPGKAYLPYAASIDADDLERMTRAIEEGCEQINPDEW